MRHRWSDADNRRLLEYAAAHGNDRAGLAAHLGLSHNTVCGHIDRTLRGRYQKAVRSYYDRMEAQREVAPFVPDAPSPSKRGAFSSVLNVPVRPFAVPLPAVAPSRTGKPLRAVVFGDTHIPFHDAPALAVVEAVIKDVKPDVLVHLGDLLDAGSLSMKFAVDPKRVDTLQGDIDFARTKLHQWARLAPKAERWLFEGNHEERLTRLVWGLDGAQRELARLRVFQQAMTWPVLLDTQAIGWRWVPYDQQPSRDCLPKLLVKHGHVVNKWGGITARNEWMRHGQSGVSGHSHRANIWRHRDDNGQSTWIEAGCTCRYDAPGAQSPDWQTAVTVIEWSADRSLMNAQQVLIRDGRAIWRGKEIGR